MLSSMGSVKSFDPIGEVESVVPRALRGLCTVLRQDLRNLEGHIAFHYPLVYQSTGIQDLVLQLAAKDYFEGLAEARGLEIIQDSEILPPIKHPDSLLVPNFIAYLSQFGEVGMSSNYDYSNGSRNAGIFLRKNDSSGLIGLLSITDSPIQSEDSLLQIDYTGYVPIPKNVSEEEFLIAPIYQLSTPPKIEGVNLAFVRLSWEVKDKKAIRFDEYEKRGIEFP